MKTQLIVTKVDNVTTIELNGTVEDIVRMLVTATVSPAQESHELALIVLTSVAGILDLRGKSRTEYCKQVMAARGAF